MHLLGNPKLTNLNKNLLRYKTKIIIDVNLASSEEQILTRTKVHCGFLGDQCLVQGVLFNIGQL